MTKRLAFHTRELKRLSTASARSRRSTPSTSSTPPQTASTTTRRGDGFIDGYGADGFLVLGANGHDQTANVDVRRASRRGTDAAAFFAARYGEYVQVKVVGDRFECR